jgi:hypothetical protein
VFNILCVGVLTVTVGASVIQPATVVRDLGVLFDQELSMTQHIARVTSSCFYQLRRLRQIRRPVTRRSAGSLVRSTEARLRQLSSCRSAKVSHLAAATRSECSSEAGSRLTDERTRDTSPEAAPLVAR